MGVGMRVYVGDIADESKLFPMGVGITETKYIHRKTDDKKPIKVRNQAPTSVIEKQPEELQVDNKVGNVEPTNKGGDNSSKIVDSLSEKQRKIFDEIPLDKAITVDYLTAAGFSMGEVMSTLTILEIKGLISSLPGALYIRK